MATLPFFSILEDSRYRQFGYPFPTGLVKSCLPQTSHFAVPDLQRQKKNEDLPKPAPHHTGRIYWDDMQTQPASSSTTWTQPASSAGPLRLKLASQRRNQCWPSRNYNARYRDSAIAEHHKLNVRAGETGGTGGTCPSRTACQFLGKGTRGPEKCKNGPV